MSSTRAKLLSAAAQTVRESGLAAASARAIAARAQVNQALVFYHFGTVSDLLEAACRQAVDDSAAHYRDQFAAVTSLTGLLAVGRELHERERSAGNVAMMAQFMSGAQHDPVLARAAHYAMSRWTTEIEEVVGRVLKDSPLAEIADISGLARALGAGFIGLELYEGVDAAGMRRALESLDQMALVVEVVNDLGPIARRALRSKLRSRKTRTPKRQDTNHTDRALRPAESTRSGDQ
jgi:AcrR family transcriptional regulator